MREIRTDPSEAAKKTDAAIFTPTLSPVDRLSLASYKKNKGSPGISIFQKNNLQNGPLFFELSTSDKIYRLSLSSTSNSRLSVSKLAYQSLIMGLKSHIFLALSKISVSVNPILLGRGEQNSTEVNMAMCRRCVGNGVSREGGELGICNYHSRTKCRICKTPSLGAELCSVHEHSVEVQRWKAKSKFRVGVSAVEAADDLEIRKARLQDAKFLAHQAVEVIFQSLLGAIVAIWANPKSWEKFKEDEEAA